MRLPLPSGKQVILVARKRIVFVIVEGPSDDTALGLLLNQYYAPHPVYVQILRRDITTESGAKPENILTRVAAEIRKYARDNHLEKLHFQEIIHLTDTDGAYVGDESIIEDTSAASPIYTQTAIRTRNKTGIEHRNRQKRANLDKLASTRSIWGIPYRIFYLSCNLDHVLYNKLNTSDEEKETDAFRFAKQYKGKVPDFVRFISQSDFSVHGRYSDTWQYIRSGLNSLERHTNLGLCFADDSPETDPI